MTKQPILSCKVSLHFLQKKEEKHLLWRNNLSYYEICHEGADRRDGMLKIAHINSTDTKDKAAEIWQLLDNLPAREYEQRLFVYEKTTADQRVIAINNAVPWADRNSSDKRRKALPDIYSPAVLGILAHPFFAQADIIHIHSTAGGYFSYLLLPFLGVKPLVWSMNQPDPFTAGGPQPLIQLKNTLSQLVDLHIICPSEEMKSQLGSSIVQRHDIRLIDPRVSATLVPQYQKLYREIAPEEKSPRPIEQQDTVITSLLQEYNVPQMVEQAQQKSWKAVWQVFQTQYKKYDEKQMAQRGSFTDLFFGYCLGKIQLPADHEVLWYIAEQWFNCRKLPPRCGGMPAKQYNALLYYCRLLRQRLHQYFAETPLEQTVKLTEKQQLIMIAIWRQVFLNAFSTLNMQADSMENGYQKGEAMLADKEEQGWYPKLIIASMYAPFAADRVNIQTGRLLNSTDIPMWCKAVLAFWLVSTPYFNSEERHRQKILTYVADFCQSALQSSQNMSLGFFRAFLEETMSGLWRASYIGGNNLRELSIFGDFIHVHMKKFYPKFKDIKFTNKPKTKGKQRIGYISRNFCSQAVSYYMVNRMINHDRDKFEIYTFVVGDRYDDMTKIFEQHSDKFIRMDKEYSIEKMAKTVVDSKLDMLIYGDIGMDPLTYMLAGLQLAPVQSALVGHGITTGLPTMQYYISGDFEPHDADQHYREKLIRLPNLGAAQYPPGDFTEKFTRKQLGIPEDAVVFVSCANGIKHGPARDRILVEILKQAPNAWIVLKPFQNPPSIHPGFAKRVMETARTAGVGKRLLILPPLPKPQDVLGLLSIADIQLDTYPYGGWTTNMEALYMGLPLVTQQGGMMRNRWGAFMLRALGIREGIAGDEAEYVAWAVKMAKDAAMRSRLKKQIQSNVMDVLFNGKQAQPAYEQALLEALQESQGLEL